MSDLKDFFDSVDYTPKMHIQARQTANTTGPSVSGADVIDIELDTVISNTITGASLDGSYILTLPAGKYQTRAISSAQNVAAFRLSWEVQDTVNEYIAWSPSVFGNNTEGIVMPVMVTVLEFSVETDLKLIGACDAAGKWGKPADDSFEEVYADVMIHKIGGVI